MKSPQEPKNAVDLLGFEYDWLCCDLHGHVALFSTAGSGFAPAPFLHDTDAHDDAIETTIALPASTEAKFAPRLPDGLINTWKLVAERGLFAFDSEPTGGPYHVVAAPEVPVQIGDLPPGVSRVASRIMLTVDFEATTEVTENQLREMRL